MAKTMKAARVHKFGDPLVIEDVPIPSPGPGQILIKVAASGVCHTDLHAVDGDWPVKPKLPLIPGHEGVGPVAALGAGVTDIKEGDLVGVPWLHDACGKCEFCVTGWETVCEKQALHRLLRRRRLCRVCAGECQLCRPSASGDRSRHDGADPVRRRYGL